jgi:hypothetical protein
MLSEPSSGEYRYPDLKFMVRIHHVTERRIDGVGKGGKGEDVLNRFLSRALFSSRRVSTRILIRVISPSTDPITTDSIACRE